jgi:hypothetical protein
MNLFSPKLQLRKIKCKFAGRAQWNDPHPLFQLHQLAFDTALKLLNGIKNESLQQTKVKNVIFIRIFGRRMAHTGRCCGTTRLLASTLSMDILQTPVEIWLAGETILKPGYTGIQNQR